MIKFDISRDDTTFLYEKIAAGYRNLFCYNDMIAYEILKRLDDLVVDVRRMFPDLHVVGFDGLCTRLPGLKQITTVSASIIADTPKSSTKWSATGSKRPISRQDTL